MTRRRLANRSDAALREVAAVLEAHGLTRPVDSPILAGHEVPWGLRFADAARRLGPEFVLFGHYLSTRPDLMPLADVLALAELTPGDVDLPLPAAARNDLSAQVEAALEQPASAVFAEIDREPHHLGFLCIEVRARLREAASQDPLNAAAGAAPDRSSREVVLRLHRPGVEVLRQVDTARLVGLWPAFAHLEGSHFERDGFQRLLEDFAAWLGRRLDLRAEAVGLSRFANGLVDGDALAVPDFALHLCTPGLSVRADLGGRRLRVESDAGDGEASVGGHSQSRRFDTVRRLHLAWLQQLLVAGEVPLDAEWIELEDGRLALVAGRCERVAAASLPRLDAYLQHVAGHRPEAACAAIVGELRPMRRDTDERNLRLALRQVVPFRDGGWSERRDTLAELLVLHWRLIREHGYEVSPALAACYAGCFEVADLGRRLGVEGDPLHAAFEDLRWLSHWRGLRALADPRGLADAMEQNLAALLDMPQKLDRLLDLATGDADGARLRLRVSGRGREPADKRGSAALTWAVCLTLLMASLLLVTGRVPDLIGAQPGLAGGPFEAWVDVWLQPLSAALFLGLGALLLRIILRGSITDRRRQRGKR